MDQPGNHVLLRGNQPAAADRMRELLARTVQDHVTDQRTNAGTLEDIRQRMEGLEWLVKDVREREVAGLTTQLDELGRRMDETAQRPPRWAESLAEHMELLRSQVAPVAELHSLWADLGTVSENVEGALPQLQSVCDAVGEAVAALRSQDERLNKLQQSVGKLQQSMESAASRFSRLDKAVAELTQRTGQLDKEISAVKGRAEVSFGALAAKVDQNAEATSRQLTQSLEAMSANVEGLSGRVSDVGGQVDLIGGQVQVVQGRIERLDERLADTDDKLGSLDTRLTATDEKIGSADTRVAGLDARLERLDERLDDQYDRVSAIGSALTGTDAKLGGLDAKLGGLDAKLEQLDGRLGEHGRGLTSVEGKLGTVAGRLGMVDGKVGSLGTRIDGLDGVTGQLETLGRELAAVGSRVDSQAEQLAGQIEPLADELRSRPGPTDVQEILAKIVDAAQDDVTAHLGSLEETVLTLAEALLRPQGGRPEARTESRPVPAPRDSAGV